MDGVVVVVGDVSRFDVEGVKGLPHNDASGPSFLQNVIIERPIILLPEVW